MGKQLLVEEHVLSGDELDVSRGGGSAKLGELTHRERRGAGRDGGDFCSGDVIGRGKHKPQRAPPHITHTVVYL